MYIPISIFMQIILLLSAGAYSAIFYHIRTNISFCWFSYFLVYFSELPPCMPSIQLAKSVTALKRLNSSYSYNFCYLLTLGTKRQRREILPRLLLSFKEAGRWGHNPMDCFGPSEHGRHAYSLSTPLLVILRPTLISFPCSACTFMDRCLKGVLYCNGRFEGNGER